MFVTHPIQYQAPLWRELASYPEIDLTVHYFSDQGVSERIDPGFGQAFAWDLPLLDGYRWRFLSKRPIREAQRFRIPGARQFFEESRFDVVLLHGYTHFFVLQILVNARHFGYKVILRGEFSELPRKRSPWKRTFRDIFLRWLYRRVDHLCPIGTDAIRHLERYGVRQDKMTLTPYSIDDRLLASQKEKLDRATCRRKLGFSDNHIVFLFSGKMIERKQPLLLARAARSLADDQRIALVFIGDGEQRDAVCSMLAPLLGPRFLAPGFVNQSALGQYFVAADVLVLPSQFDTWGLVVNEAMHFGLPCIVSDMVGSSRDLVIPYSTGFVFPSGKEDALCAAMKTFLDNNGLARAMGEAASRHIAGFTTAKAAAGIREAVLKAMSGSKESRGG